MLDRTPDVASIVARVMERHAGDDNKIEQVLLAKSRQDPALAEEFVLMGIRQAVRTQYSLNRNRASREPMPEAERQERLEKREERRKFWDRYTLFGHQALVDATSEELRESAARRKQMASTSLRRARFEVALADRMGDSTKTVGEFFKASEVARLAEEHNA